MYASPNIIRVIELGWAGNVARKGAMRSAYNILIGKPERTTRKTYA